ncbi:sensor histidine kinase WalK [Lachnospiraceae bacterium]|nr:sensor histidine kinase WalK [Lachnospiraceae bacterium]
MVIVLVVLIGICMLLTMQYARSILAVRSLRRQLEEIERGSHMEISVECRQREMLSLCRQLNRLRQHWFLSQRQYEKAEKKLKQNITSLAHDIRTPLTGAAGYIQLAQECEDFVKREHYLETASDRLKELGDMLEELFLYTKLTSVEFELNMCELQVLPLLSECLVSLYRQFEEKGVSPEVEFESESFRIKADEECLRRIFHNLIQNGLIHGRGGLSIRQSKTSVFFENLVSETSVPDTDQIFDRFYKADSARRKGSSGLGMFIVKELAERMGGQVEAQLNRQMLTIRLEFPEVE